MIAADGRRRRVRRLPRHPRPARRRWVRIGPSSGSTGRCRVPPRRRKSGAVHGRGGGQGRSGPTSTDVARSRRSGKTPEESTTPASRSSAGREAAATSGTAATSRRRCAEGRAAAVVAPLADRRAGGRSSTSSRDGPEQTDPHVILRAITPSRRTSSGNMSIATRAWSFGPARTAFTPMQTPPATCWATSRVSTTRTWRPTQKADELRQYFPNDQVGRSGLEASASALRGTEGNIGACTGTKASSGARIPAPARTSGSRSTSSSRRNRRRVHPSGATTPRGTSSWPCSTAPPSSSTCHRRGAGDGSYPTYDLNDWTTCTTSGVTSQPAADESRDAVPAPAGIDGEADGGAERDYAGPDPSRRDRVHRLLDARREEAPVGRCWVATKFASARGERGASPDPVDRRTRPASSHSPTRWSGAATFTSRRRRPDRLEGICYW